MNEVTESNGLKVLQYESDPGLKLSCLELAIKIKERDCSQTSAEIQSLAKDLFNWVVGIDK